LRSRALSAEVGDGLCSVPEMTSVCGVGVGGTRVGVLVGVAVGGTRVGVLVRVAVGGTDVGVLVRVAVGGIDVGVLVRVAVGGTGVGVLVGVAAIDGQAMPAAVSAPHTSSRPLPESGSQPAGPRSLAPWNR
jgi:hypothetical protein